MLVTDMLGTSSIAIVMGPGKEYIEVGSQLSGEGAPGLMDNVSQNLLPGITAMIPKIDSLLTAVTAVAANPSVGTSIEHLNGTLANLETASAQLNTLMRSMPRIVNDAGTTMMVADGPAAQAVPGQGVLHFLHIGRVGGRPLHRKS